MRVAQWLTQPPPVAGTLVTWPGLSLRLGGEGGLWRRVPKEASINSLLFGWSGGPG